MNKNDLQPGRRFRHYGNGETYEIIGLGLNSDNVEECFVMYRGLYNSPEFGDQPLWVRPLATFMEPAVVDGETVERYQPLD